MLLMESSTKSKSLRRRIMEQKRQRNVHRFSIASTVLLLLTGLNYSAIAGDLDDGIKSDDPINDDLKLDNSNEFIMTKAKTKARKARNDGKDSGDVITADGTGNIAIGAGTDLKGATIINMSDNEGATVLSE